MRRIITIVLLSLLAMPSVVEAQKKGRKEVSPIIEGKQKVRKVNYDSVWKFTTFNSKKIYYCDFDYRTFKELPTAREFNYGNFQPVLNFLATQARTPLLICATYAINPSVTDKAKRLKLKAVADSQAVEAMNGLVEWMTDEKYKNKVQIRVAQVDYRYWWGDEFWDMELPSDDIISVGLVMFFGSRKINLFPSIAEGAPTFKPVKFFPNDAELLDSYDPLIKEVADYLKQNEEMEVLLRGYSDNTGTEMYNEAISRQRATEIKKALIKHNIAPTRIEIEALGAINPVGDNNTRVGRIENNRVEMIIQ